MSCCEKKFEKTKELEKKKKTRLFRDPHVKVEE